MTDPDLAAAIGDDLATPPDIEADWLNDLAATIVVARPPGTIEQCGAQIAAITKLRAKLADYLADTSAAMHPMLPHKETVILDGLGGFTPTWTSKSTKYDNAGLLPVVLDSTRRELNPETGELEPVDEKDWQKVVRVWTMPPSKAPSTKALAEYGIEGERLDNYRTREDGRPTVKYEPAS